MRDFEPIHITVPASPSDPRSSIDEPEGVVIHYVPELDPADVCVVDGIRTTTPARTLIDLAEVLGPDELRGCFVRAREIGLLDMEELYAARARVEWRPSLETLDKVTSEFT